MGIYYVNLNIVLNQMPTYEDLEDIGGEPIQSPLAWLWNYLKSIFSK